jgi:hypothetical protein
MFTTELFERLLQLLHRERAAVCLEILREMISAEPVLFVFDQLDTFFIRFLVREQPAKVAALVPKLDLMSRASTDVELLVRVASFLFAKTHTRTFDESVFEQPPESPIFQLTNGADSVSKEIEESELHNEKHDEQRK